MRRRAISTVGATVCGVVLVVVVVTKFVHGAGFAIAAMAVLFVIMTRISRHYARVSRELQVDPGETDHTRLPSRVHAIVLVSRIHKPALRALAYARATRPSRLEAVTVSVDKDENAVMVAGETLVKMGMVKRRFEKGRYVWEAGEEAPGA